MQTTRKSGILLHPTSLPSPYGMGDFGEQAYKFIDTLAKANQKLWQVLPLCPIDGSGSPYQSASAFAGEPLFISLEKLVDLHLLTPDDLTHLPQRTETYTDYAFARAVKYPLLKKAFLAFTPTADYTDFCVQNAYWLADYSLFMAVKEHLAPQQKADTKGLEKFLKKETKTLTKEVLTNYFNNACWCAFPDDLRKRTAKALKKWTALLENEIAYHNFLQYMFHTQWHALKQFATDHDIAIIGDAPIFVAYDSADVWANQKSFLLDKDGFPKVVAGVPPDYFSETGQLWGNPLYNWAEQKKTNYAWWISRVKKNLTDVDILRIDHFRAFESYWEIPADAEDARSGVWKKSVGIDFFHALKEELGDLPIIAEDLGIITEEVTALRKQAHLPGMAILQFAFGEDKNNAYLPHSVEKDTVIYTGTHDNNTSLGWYQNATEAEQDHYRRYMNTTGDAPSWDMIRLALSSPANTAIIPVQDVLLLGEEYRMNLPGTAQGNWSFAFTWDMWNEGQIEGLRYLCALFGRNAC